MVDILPLVNKIIYRKDTMVLMAHRNSDLPIEARYFHGFVCVCLPEGIPHPLCSHHIPIIATTYPTTYPCMPETIVPSCF